MKGSGYREQIESGCGGKISRCDSGCVMRGVVCNLNSHGVHDSEVDEVQRS